MKTIYNKICLAGKNEIAVYGLELLTEKIGNSSIIALGNDTDPGYDTWQPSFKKRAHDLGIPLVTLEDCYSMEDLLFLSLEFAELIKPDRFASTDLINIHFSALPAYKGMFTSAHPLLNNEAQSGVTLHKIDRGIDTGEIIDQVIFDIKRDYTCRDLYFEYLAHSKILFKRNVENLVQGKIKSTPQASYGSTYYSKSSIVYSDLKLDLNQTAFNIQNQVRAFTFPEYQVPRIINYFVRDALVTSTPSTSRPGKILEVSSKELLLSSIDYNIILARDKINELLFAAKESDYKLAEDCISLGVNLNWRNGQGWSALIIACYHGSLDIIDLLIQSGANINQSNYRGTTPIMYAMRYYEMSGDIAPFIKLLEHGADLNLRDITQRSIHDYAKLRYVSGVNEYLTN